MKCPKCKKENATQSQYGLLPCKSCIASDRKKVAGIKTVEFTNAKRAERIQDGRLKHAKDILYPWDMSGKPNKDFVDTYQDKAREYFTEEELLKL